MSSTDHPDGASGAIRLQFVELQVQIERIRVDTANLDRAVQQTIADTGASQEKLSGFSTRMKQIGHDVINLRTGMLAILNELDRLFPFTDPTVAPAPSKAKAAKS